MKIIVCVVCINNHMSNFQDNQELHELFIKMYPDEKLQTEVMEAIKSNFSNKYMTTEFKNKLTSILKKYKDNQDDVLTLDVLIEELGDYKNGGRRSKKRPTARRRRSSKARKSRKARKARATRRR